MVKSTTLQILIHHALAVFPALLAWRARPRRYRALLSGWGSGAGLGAKRKKVWNGAPLPPCRATASNSPFPSGGLRCAPSDGGYDRIIALGQRPAGISEPQNLLATTRRRTCAGTLTVSHRFVTGCGSTRFNTAPNSPRPPRVHGECYRAILVEHFRPALVIVPADLACRARLRLRGPAFAVVPALLACRARPRLRGPAFAVVPALLACRARPRLRGPAFAVVPALLACRARLRLRGPAFAVVPALLACRARLRLRGPALAVDPDLALRARCWFRVVAPVPTSAPAAGRQPGQREADHHKPREPLEGVCKSRARHFTQQHRSSPFPAGPAGFRLDSGVSSGRQTRATVTLKVRSVVSAGLSSNRNVARADVASFAMVTTTGSST